MQQKCSKIYKLKAQLQNIYESQSQPQDCCQCDDVAIFQYWHSRLAPVLAAAAPLPIYLPDNGLGKTGKDGPNVCEKRYAHERELNILVLNFGASHKKKINK